MNSFIFQIFWDCSSKKLLGNNYMYLIWNFAMWDHGGGDIGHIMLDFLTKRAIFLFQVIGKPSIEEFLWCQQKCTLDCEILGPLKPQTKKKNYLHVGNLSTFRQIIFCVVAVVAWQVPEGIIECQKLSTGFEGLDGFPVEFIIRILPSPLHLSFSLMGDNNQGIRKSVFLSILDSVARVVLVNVSSLGEGFPCAAFSRAIPETFPRVLVPFPLGWERLVTYGLPLAEVGGEAQCIDPT